MLLIGRDGVRERSSVRVGHDTSQHSHLPLVVRHEGELVLGMEAHQLGHGAGRSHRPQRRQGKQLGQEVVPQPEIGEPSLVFDCGVGKTLQHGAPEQPGSAIRRLGTSLATVDLGVLDPAGG